MLQSKPASPAPTPETQTSAPVAAVSETSAPTSDPQTPSELPAAAALSNSSKDVIAIFSKVVGMVDVLDGQVRPLVLQVAELGLRVKELERGGAKLYEELKASVASREELEKEVRAERAKDAELQAALEAQQREVAGLKSFCSSLAAPDHSAEPAEFVLLGEGGEEHPAANALP